MSLKRVLSVLCFGGIFFSAAYAQSMANKNAGVAFRVDDSHSASEYSAYANIFRKYGYNFTLAPNLAPSMHSGYYNMIDTIRNLTNDGNELADHTPNHNSKWFTVLNTSPYIHKAGVDHIIESSETICLKYDHVITSSHTDEGLINVIGNKVISANPGEFRVMGDLHAIYLNDTLYSYNPDSIITSSTYPDTIKGLMSYWGEPVYLTPLSNIPYEKLDIFDVVMSIDALKLLGQATSDLCNMYNLPAPTTWMQPGGSDYPQLRKGDVSQSFGSIGYATGAVYPEASKKVYNEYNPDNDCSFAMEWEDFREDISSLQTVKHIIANKVALHTVSIGYSHFNNLLGGWTGYLNRMDSLLAWCRANNIPVRTYRQWADILYKTPQNPYINIMPDISTDLDNDNIPDGYSLSAGTTIDSTDYPAAGSMRKSMVQNTAGQFFSIDYLGGIEKGQVYFCFYAKGTIGTEIKLDFHTHRVTASDIGRTFYFRITAAGWQKYELANSISDSTKLFIPIDANTLKVTMSCTTFPQGAENVKISGFVFKKFNSNSIIPPFLDKTVFADKVDNVMWEINSINHTMFILQRKYSSDEDYKNIAVLEASVNSFSDNMLDMPAFLKSYDTTSVYYRVIALNSSDSSYSNIDAIVVPTASVLPVELQDFTGNAADNKVFLKWNTVSEIQNYGFDVQRKKGSDWEKIGFVNGNGNSNSLKKYMFIDKDISGSSKLSYRLKQIDFNSRYNYSQVIEVNAAPDKFELFQNYPNPFNPATIITYSIPKAGIVTLALFNVLGEKVSQLVNGYKEPGRYKIELKAGNSGLLSSGIYFYSLKSGNIQLTKKMLMLK
jgi:hypothetical protein